MIKTFTKYILALAALLCVTTNAWAQKPVNNNGTWYSLYDTEEHSKYTTTTANNDITICTHSVFIPSTGALEFKTRMTKFVLTNPGEYSILVGGKTIDLPSKQTSYVTKTTTISSAESNLEFKLKYNSYNTARDVYIDDVKLPLANHILFADGTYGTASKSISFGKVAIDDASNAQVVSLRSFLTTGNITIKSNDNAFRIKNSTNTNGDVYAVGANACAASGGSGNAGGSNLGNIDNYTVTIYFCPSEAKDYSATITLTDGTSTATISVSGTGLKKNQSIVWSEKFAADKPSIPVGKEVSDAATATSGLTPIIYSSSDESIIAITNDGKSFKALAAGTATITASQAGDNKWNSISSSKTITVTEKKIQYIHWTDNLTRFKTGDAPFTMTATAHILVNVETEETQEVPERTALIKYTSANSNVVSVNGKVLTIVGAGETYVTATLDGDDTYERAEITMPVRVRNVSDGCELYVLDASDEVSYRADGGKYEPALFSGPPHILTFQARSGNSTRVGPINIQQYVNGEWKDIDEANPDTDWRDYWYELDRSASKIRFKSDWGSFARYFKDVLVTQATYIEPFVDGVQLTNNQVFVLPETAVGISSEKNFDLNWSTCDEEGIFLEVDDPTKFKVQPTFISAQSVHYGKTPITVTCIDPSLANSTVTGNIIITYDGNKTYTQPVECHVKEKITTWLEYHGKDTYSEADGVVANPFTLHDNDGVVAGAKISLTSSNPDILSIVEVNGEDCLQAHCGGSVVITAEFEESNKHKPCSTTVTINVPYCQREIIWERSYLNFATDENGYIEEKRVLDATINPESEITYQLHTVTSTPFAEIVEENGQHFVRVFGEGHGYIVAIANECLIEGQMYEATYKIKELRVSGASVCDPNSLLVWEDLENEPFVYKYSTNNNEKTRIYDLIGLPAETMTFGAHAASHSYENRLVISFSTESEGDNWIGEYKQEVVSGSRYNWNYSCPVPAGAKRVRFQSEATLAIYFNGINIPQQTYIRPSVESIEISDAIVNVPFEPITFSVDYSNVRLLQWKVSNNHDLGLKVVANQEVNNDCNMHGTYTFTLTGESPYPQTNVTETITFYTSAGDVVEIPVTITATLSEPFYFNVTEDGDWKNPANWTHKNSTTHGMLPDKRFPIIVSKTLKIGTASLARTGENDDLEAYGVTIEENGNITVLPTGGLTLHAGGFTNVTENNLTVCNNQDGVGFVRVSPYFTREVEGTMPNINVQYTTRAKAGGAKDQVWQYVGAPGNNMQMSNNGVMVYLWSEKEGWVYSNTNMTPFAGYALTRTASGSETYMISAQPINGDHTIDLTYTQGAMEGGNLFVNSYLAPIDVTKFTNDNNDFEGEIEKTFYLFNSGSWDQWQGQGGSTNTMVNGSSAGQYYAIAPFSAEFTASEEQKVIPPMQGVYVVVGEGGGKIKLQYNKHVFNADTKDMNRPMRAPQEEDENFMRVRLQVNSANSGADRMYIIQHENTTRGYDNGYDAKNILAEGQANIYTNEVEGQMEISVADQIDSTFIGFAAGEDSEYTLTFTSLVGEEMYLHDLAADSLFLLTEEGQYTFAAQPNSVDDMRFQLLLYPDLSNDQPGSGVTTGVDNTVTSTQLWVNDKRVYIADAPHNSTLTVYTVSGVSVTSPLTIHHAPCTIDLSHLPTGVYLLRLNNQAYKFVCE